MHSNFPPVFLQESSKVPPKWKGLPPTVQYGRHVKPLYSKTPSAQQMNAMAMAMPMPSYPDQQYQQQPQYHQQQQQMMNMMMMDSGSQPQMTDMSTMESGSGDNTVSMPVGNSGKRVPIPATPKYMNSKKGSSSATNMAVGRAGTKPPTPAELALCGKCPKCRVWQPPVTGPSVMSFPTNAAASLQKPNLRNIHTMGRQDAKNFKSVRYNHN